MPRKRITAKKLALELCGAEKLEADGVGLFAEDLLERILPGGVLAEGEPKTKGPEDITNEKQDIRHRYIGLVEKFIPTTFDFTPREVDPNEKEKEFKEFIWDVVRDQWFDGKAVMILDRIEKMLDGEVSGTEYDPEEDAGKEGKLVRAILYESYFKKDGPVPSDEDLAKKFYIHRNTVGDKRKYGAILFGILMWIYAKTREKEDIDKGIIPKPAEDKWWL